MKSYHTSIQINKPKKEVWAKLTDFEDYPNWNPLVGKLSGDIRENGQIQMHIVPLNQNFSANLIAFKPEEEMTWLGKQFSTAVIAGTHYYRLKAIDANTTLLEHGETFTGFLSYFIPKSLLQKMERSFIKHNEQLKTQIEHEG